MMKEANATRKTKKKVAIDDSLLIKGYLPVRVRFPPSPTEQDEDEREERVTFFYVKEHQHRAASHGDNDNEDEKKVPTLFVANVPSYPPIDTPTLLKALLGRFGHITRVTVVPHPRRTQQSTSITLVNCISTTTPNPTASWYFTPVVTHRFAHVVFAARRDMQKCLQALQNIMRKEGTSGSLTMDAIERQTLADTVASLRDAELDEEKAEEDISAISTGRSGIQYIYNNYLRQQRRHQNREAVLAQCNAIMEEYEQRERERVQAMSSEPDEDGFITVTHTTQPAVDTMLNEGNRQQRVSNSRGRSRKRKKGSGALPQDDFYRFQTKEKRKHDVQTLRERFQQDLERIQKIKGRGGGFQPFGRKKA
jgi:hypothetical protein